MGPPRTFFSSSNNANKLGAAKPNRKKNAVWRLVRRSVSGFNNHTKVIKESITELSALTHIPVKACIQRASICMNNVVFILQALVLKLSPAHIIINKWRRHASSQFLYCTFECGAQAPHYYFYVRKSPYRKQENKHKFIHLNKNTVHWWIIQMCPPSSNFVFLCLLVGILWSFGLCNVFYDMTAVGVHVRCGHTDNETNM